jgi:aminocarboxymuconate-semialdehyde decarboxylase
VEPIVLDIHTHLVPVDEAALAAIDGVSLDAAGAVLTVDGRKIGMKPLFAPEALIAWLDANAIDAAWFAAPPPLYRQNLSESASHRWVNYINDGLAAIARHFPRLTAMPHLPIEHPDVAADLATLAIAVGQRRFSIPSGGPGRMLSDKAYETLWRALDAASAFVLVHPGENDDPRLVPFYLTNLLGNPYETTVAIAHLVFGGILTLYPNITFCFAHGGGAAPMLAGRFEQGFQTDRPGIDKSLPSPRLLLKRLMVDCVTHDAEALHLAETVFGPDRILFGSDWPFPMGTLQPHEKLSAIAPAVRKRIYQDNLKPFRGWK